MINKNTFLLIICFMGYVLGFGQQSFTLQEAIDYGIKNSNEVKIKMLATEDANQQIKEYKSIGMPKVSGSVSYQHYLALPAQPVADFITPSVYGVLFDEAVIPERDLGPPATFKFTLFQPNILTGGIELSSVLFDASYLYAVKGAKLYKELIAKEKDITEDNLKTNIIKAYTAVLIAEENKKILQNNINNLDKSLKEVKALFDSGFAESLDVDRLQLSYDNLNIEVDRVNQMIDISKNLLKFQMNYPLSSEISLKEDINVLLNGMALNENINTDNINFGERPEYELIGLGQRANALEYKSTKAGYYPTARGFVSAQTSLQRQNLFDNDETGWIPQSLVGVTLNIPIYDGGDRSAKLQRIRLKTEKTALEKENFEKAMTLQVKNALLGFENAKNIMNSRKKAVDVNQNIYDKTLIKFKEGVGSSVEVTQSELSLYQAQGTYINAIYDLLSAKIDLQTALGKQ